MRVVGLLYTVAAFGGYEHFDKSGSTLIFVALKEALSSHKPWMKYVDNFTENPSYYCHDHTRNSLARSVSFFQIPSCFRTHERELLFWGV